MRNEDSRGARAGGSCTEKRGCRKRGAGGHGSCIPTCVPTPSPARRRDRRQEYRLTTAYPRDSVFPRNLHRPRACATFRILRSLVHVSRSPTPLPFAPLRAIHPPATPTPSTSRSYYHPYPPPPDLLVHPAERCIFLHTLVDRWDRVRNRVSSCCVYRIKSLAVFASLSER